MQDSIQLPQSVYTQSSHIDGENIEPNMINELISPHTKTIQNQNTIQESLIYSNSTRGHFTQRSPTLTFPYILHDSSPNVHSNRKIYDGNQVKVTMRDRRTPNQSPQAKQFHRTDRITIDSKAQMAQIRKRSLQLENALTQEQKINQQLKAKIAVLTQALEHKIRESSLNVLLGMNNSSKNLKNIDIYVQLKKLHTKLQQKEQQIVILKEQKEKLQKKETQQSNRCRSNRDTKLQENNLFSIKEESILSSDSDRRNYQMEKQSLITYIDEQNVVLMENRNMIKSLKSEIERMQKKEQSFINEERNKFTRELCKKGEEIQKMQEELEKLRLEGSLLELRHRSQIQSIKDQLAIKPHSPNRQTQKPLTIEQGCNPIVAYLNNTGAQTVERDNDLRLQKLVQQTKLLKKERDYYIAECNKGLKVQGEHSVCELKMKRMQQQLMRDKGNNNTGL